MKAARFTARSVPVAFFILTLAAYGLLLPFTGFYWDDWPFAWIARFLGPAGFLPAFQGFRPFLGPVFFLTTSLLPTNPIVWQVLALVIRAGTAWTAWFALDQVWPRRPSLTLSAAMLFLIFPGYSQHWVALTHINQEWISLIAYLFSFALSVRAVRGQHPRLQNTAAALGLQAIGLLPTEYFLGLELLRFLFFWIVLAETARPSQTRLKAAVGAWVPYLALWTLNAVWLAYFYRSGAYISYEAVAASTIPPVWEVVAIFLDALWKAGFYVWFQVLPLLWRSVTSPSSLGTMALIFGAFGILAAYLRHLDILRTASADPRRRKSSASGGSRWEGTDELMWPVLVGAAGIVLGRVPSFIAGLPLTLQSSFDRLTISMMLGASLFVAGVVDWLIPALRGRILILAGLVALGVGQQFFNANIFRRDWEGQQQIYWQLAWRIPALKVHTAILAQQMPLDYETDLAMTAAVNWIYAPEVHPPDLPYALIYTEKRLGGATLPALGSGVPIRLPFRTMEFNGSTSAAIVIDAPSRGCLHVFNPAQGDAETFSRLPDAISKAIPLSDPSRILADADERILPSPPFAVEPLHDWCYFYEKADLARQLGDWDLVVVLRARALEQGFEPEDSVEWLPFIEAEARAGDVDWALARTRELLQGEPKLQRGLCALWRRVRLTGPQAVLESTLAGLKEMHCSE